MRGSEKSFSPAAILIPEGLNVRPSADFAGLGLFADRSFAAGNELFAEAPVALFDADTLAAIAEAHRTRQQCECVRVTDGTAPRVIVAGENSNSYGGTEGTTAKGEEGEGEDVNSAHVPHSPLCLAASLSKRQKAALLALHGGEEHEGIGEARGTSCIITSERLLRVIDRNGIVVPPHVGHHTVLSCQLALRAEARRRLLLLCEPQQPSSHNLISADAVGEDNSGENAIRKCERLADAERRSKRPVASTDGARSSTSFITAEMEEWWDHLQLLHASSSSSSSSSHSSVVPPLRRSIGVFPMMARMNHSCCTANVSVVFDDANGTEDGEEEEAATAAAPYALGLHSHSHTSTSTASHRAEWPTQCVVRVFALRPIASGEELTFHYCLERAPHQRGKLFHVWGVPDGGKCSGLAEVSSHHCPFCRPDDADAELQMCLHAADRTLLAADGAMGDLRLYWIGSSPAEDIRALEAEITASFEDELRLFSSCSTERQHKYSDEAASPELFVSTPDGHPTKASSSSSSSDEKNSPLHIANVCPSIDRAADAMQRLRRMRHRLLALPPPPSSVTDGKGTNSSESSSADFDDDTAGLRQYPPQIHGAITHLLSLIANAALFLSFASRHNNKKSRQAI